MKLKILIFSGLILFICCDSTTNNKTNNVNLNDEVIVKNTFPSSKNSKGIINSKFEGCGYNESSIHENLAIFNPGIRETQQIKEILKYSGLPENFEIYSAEINNAIATIINDKRYILYDKNLLNIGDKMSGEYWTSMSILAHEIGHHLSGHTLSHIGSNYKAELEADKYSGFILHKMGASIEQSVKAIELFSSLTETASHPSREERINAIMEGWNESNLTRYNSAIPPTTNDIIEDLENYIFETKYILGDDYISYEHFRNQNGNGSWVSGFYEGIIIENNDGHCIINITKQPKNDGDNVFYLNARVDIHLYDHLLNMSNLMHKRLYYTLQPGRKISFAFGEEGTAPSRYFAYVKLMK